MLHKKWNFFKQKKNVKITKHAFKGFASTYNAKILHSFNPELQFKHIESLIKSKLIIIDSIKRF